MKTAIYLILALSLITTLVSCQRDTEVAKLHVIPEPNDIAYNGGYYTFVKEDMKFTNVLDTTLSKEEYMINVTSGGVFIHHSTSIGLQYGQMTLQQMYEEGDFGVRLPKVTIKDKPRFEYRGLLVDESRHFRGKKFMKSLLDQMLFHKLNKLHWHLTDDNGWRIEIKKYPILTDVGAKMNYSKGRTDEAQFYTQEDIKEIIAYASERGIDIIPEIDMPGHMNAAISAYPTLTDGDIEKRRAVPGLCPVVLDVSNDKTIEFCKNVLAEVCDLFPYHLIHLGGDEVPKQQWKDSESCQKMIKKLKLANEEELQSWFLLEMEKFVQGKGKKIAGWDEILEGGMSNTTTVYHWQGWIRENTKKAAERGHEVIVCKNNRFYFDYFLTLDKGTFEPKAQPYSLPMYKVYNHDPIPTDLDEKFHDAIKGVQGHLWSEFIPSEKIMQQRLFPRIAALAEVAWTEQEKRDWENMNRKLPFIFDIYDSWGINYNRAYISCGSTH